MISDDTINIVLAGVGGLGVIKAGDLIALAALEAGYDVKKSEIHGMAQRGGSVISHVRFGRKVWSPVIARGRAQFLLGFEKLEAMRYAHLAMRGGKVILNNMTVNPPSVNRGEEEYPLDIEERLKAMELSVVLVDGLRLAQGAGDGRAMNTVVLGRLSCELEIDEHYWKKAIKSIFSGRSVVVNLQAFELGRRLKTGGL